ncbi:MAG TPA: exodeoxyribonuclease VII small subunit [Candidatus Dormibacteraeota bacterium]|nr:exodeoxyribonuclease VII small subunit [Candidatus Dormibacteraeota bacterium]
MTTDGDLAALTYEQALAELDTLIQRLEGGSVNLDEAIACYERASRLAQHCAELLDRTEQKITQLVVGPSGPQERAFSPDAVPAPQPAPGAAGTLPPPSVPPPPTAPVRARAVRPSSAPALPGLEPASREPELDIDPDDIPF